MTEALHWLMFGRLPITPLGLFGALYWSNEARKVIAARRRRRRVEVIDTATGFLTVEGADDETLARLVERTGGRLRPKGRKP